MMLPLVLSGVSPLRGLPFANGDCADVLALDVAWSYNWWPAAHVCAASVEAVPMLWGADSLSVRVGGSSDWLMGFNEPDVTSQANITPTRAAYLWHQIEQLHPDYRLVSPATTHGDVLGWDGTPWLEQFRAAYWAMYGRPPRLDALALHCYADTHTCKAALDTVLGRARAWGVGEVWLTEFGFADCPQWGGTEAAQAFMRDMVAYCEVQNVRYGWFTNRLRGNQDSYMPRGCSTVLLDYDTRALTALGHTWLEVASGK